MNSFDPPPFRPHLVFRGGHLQTLASIRQFEFPNIPTTLHRIAVSDGDHIVLHDSTPQGWTPGQPSLLVVHGLTGCHAAPYMLRLASQFYASGVRVFRMDLRGCGAGIDSATQLTHAGRSDDLIHALSGIASLTSTNSTAGTSESSDGGPIGAIAISLSGNQLLRAVGRIGGGLDPSPPWFDRLTRLAVVAPPIDLGRCSENMQRISRRLYNRYFIASLIRSVPPKVKQRADYQRAITGTKPRTLLELDDRITAPLSGFRDAADYYSSASAHELIRHNPLSTLVLAAADDPLVPVGCFVDDRHAWPANTQLVVAETGGHVGFIDRGGRFWMDTVLGQWFADWPQG